jgi:hypothetical protein
MYTSKTLPVYQLEAVMNLDNVYGMDEIIGDPIHAFGSQESPKKTFNWLWLLLLLVIPLVIFLIWKFKR